ncbi:MAG: hypothetical protein ACI9FG_001946 [Crocinitomicaceae bacterium]|jgi:hypothetical protein
MSWIQENKFTAALAGVTAVGSIVLISLSMGKGDDIASAQIKLKKALRNEKSIQSVQPFPNRENLEHKQSTVNDYEKGARSLQRQFAAYRPNAKDVEDFAPDKFSAIVSSYRNRLNKKFKKNDVELPDQCVYGFEAYANKFPRPEATGELSYQIKAMEWLFSELANNKPEALLNVVRDKFDLESAPVAVTRGRRGRRGRNAVEQEPEYYVMPLELSFRSDEKVLSNFLEEIANTDKYPFVIRSMHIQNERMTPPTEGDAEFEKAAIAGGGNDFFDFAPDFENEGNAGEPDEPLEGLNRNVAGAVLPVAAAPVVGDDSDDTRLLKPILGGENVNVFLKLNLILLNKSAVLTLDEMEKKAEIEQSSSASDLTD